MSEINRRNLMIGVGSAIVASSLPGVMASTVTPLVSITVTPQYAAARQFLEERLTKAIIDALNMPRAEYVHNNRTNRNVIHRIDHPSDRLKDLIEVTFAPAMDTIVLDKLDAAK